MDNPKPMPVPVAQNYGLADQIADTVAPSQPGNDPEGVGQRYPAAYHRMETPPARAKRQLTEETQGLRTKSA